MVNIPKNPFILVDGSSYLFRAYHGLPPLTTSKGQPTGAIFGVINMLRKLLKEYQPERIAVVFDSKEKNFRHSLFKPYKANRIVMPEELQHQIEPLHNVIRAMGLPLILLSGVEADDIIGTLAREAKEKAWFTLISTGDKDFAQLVDDKIILINTMSQDTFDRQRVIEKFGVPPEKMIDYLALIGDSVDNIPGIPNVGPKTAVKWLEAYGSLENIVQNAQAISGRVGENLRASLELLPLYQKLVTIDVNLSLNLDPSDILLKNPDHKQLARLFSELEFKSWLKEIDLSVSEEQEIIVISPPSDKANYELVLTQSQFTKWLDRLKTSDLFAIDTETTSLNYMRAELVGISFSVVAGEAAYIPLAHDYFDAPEQLSRDWVIEQLKPILEDPKRFKVGHHIKYDAEVLSHYGIKLNGIKFDTMLESYILNSTALRHDLNTLSQQHLGIRPITYEEVAGKGAKQILFSQVPVEQACLYAAEDADLTLRLHQQLWPKIEKEKTLKFVFETIEMPLVPVLMRMELGGVLIDPKALREQSDALAKRMMELEKGAYEMAGCSFNLNSPKQLQEILFTQLKLPILEKTPTGQASTSEAVLQELAVEFPLPKVILEYRSLAKLKSTYTDKLPELINPKTGRVHTSYHQAVTATGRLSSSDPNLQNIPIRTAEGRKIRTAFIAPQGFKIMAVDYSQIELRIMAELSQDEHLIKAFVQGDDIHRSTAAKIFGVSLEAVTNDQRRSAKAINFGLMYGMSAFGLSRQLGITPKEAEKHVGHYFKNFPKVKVFMDHIRKQALEKGYVETLFGRRLYLPDLESRNQGVRRAAERAAINAPMQGSNADIIKRVMIELDRWIQETGTKLRMIMQVHDELVFEVAEEALNIAKEKVRSVMENNVELSVKLRIGLGVGNNWEEAHS